MSRSAHAIAGPVVGVFDSGVGGLSVFEAVRARLPGARYAYCSDNGNFPYGTKSEDEVVACTHAAATRFIREAALDLLIVACNTASTVALPRLRQSLDVPVVGVVPAIKPATQMTRTHTIALLATPGTVERAYTDEMIRTFATACRVIKTGSSLLVDLAERKLRGEPVDLEQVRNEILPMFAASPDIEWKKLDTVVLGCTHFPLLKEELQAAAPWSVQWVDSSEAIAAHTAYLLHQAGFDDEGLRGVSPEQAPRAYVTRLDDTAESLRPAMTRLGFASLAAL